MRALNHTRVMWRRVGVGEHYEAAIGLYVGG